VSNGNRPATLPGNCARCGKGFMAKDRRRVYCGTSCRVLASRDRKLGVEPSAPQATDGPPSELGPNRIAAETFLAGLKALQPEDVVLTQLLRTLATAVDDRPADGTTVRSYLIVEKALRGRGRVAEVVAPPKDALAGIRADIGSKRRSTSVSEPAPAPKAPTNRLAKPEEG
jgi:hypothetical protein